MNPSRLPGGLVGALFPATLLALAASCCAPAAAPGATPPAPAPPASSPLLVARDPEPPPRGQPAASAAPSGSAAGWHEYHRPMTTPFVVEAIEASSTYPNWPVSRLTDGDPSTSWFSDRDDSAAKEKTPSVTLRLGDRATVRRVVVLGNRDLTWSKGFSVLRGRVQLFSSEGKLLRSIDQTAEGAQRDFDFKVVPPAEEALIVIFSSLADEGNQNTYGDIGLAEFWVE